MLDSLRERLDEWHVYVLGGIVVWVLTIGAVLSAGDVRFVDLTNAAGATVAILFGCYRLNTELRAAREKIPEGVG